LLEAISESLAGLKQAFTPEIAAAFAKLMGNKKLVTVAACGPRW
jgi:ethanolamine ammonia-lyase large subunit